VFLTASGGSPFNIAKLPELLKRITLPGALRGIRKGDRFLSGT
jgi:hypothetical protein